MRGHLLLPFGGYFFAKLMSILFFDKKIEMYSLNEFQNNAALYL